MRYAKFGPFQLLPESRLLLKDGEPVAIGDRALDILTVLVERPGAVFLKQELFDRIWPRLHVEESCLRGQIATLRRVLGDGVAGARYVANVPGRGYCFVASVAFGDTHAGAAPTAGALSASTDLAPDHGECVGRTLANPGSLLAALLLAIFPRVAVAHWEGADGEHGRCPERDGRRSNGPCPHCGQALEAPFHLFDETVVHSLGALTIGSRPFEGFGLGASAEAAPSAPQHIVTLSRVLGEVLTEQWRSSPVARGELAERQLVT